MTEIIGNNMAQVFAAWNIPAKMTFKRDIDWEDSTIEVWEMAPREAQVFFDAVNAMDEGEWCEKFPVAWYRSAKGSNLDKPDAEFIVNGKKLLAWDGYFRNDYDSEYEEYCRECEECGEECASFEEWERDFYPRKYSDIITYICDEIGASTPKNVCAILTDLAKYNKMKISELLDAYCPLIESEDANA